MKPAAFDYMRASSIAEAVAALTEAGEDGRVLAGGQSLGAMLNMRLATPGLLVDVMHIDALNTLREEGDALVVPAAVTQAQLLAWPGLEQKLPILARALPWVGHVQTRARGTVCGSVAHADPSAELPLCLVLLGGDVRIRSRRRSRDLPAAEFFRGTMLTALEPGQIIESVRFPLARPGQRFAFREVGRRHGDFAIVAVAAVRDGRSLRLAVGGVDDKPRVVEWTSFEADNAEEKLNELAWSLDTRDDLHATARYRRDLVRNLGRAVIGEVFA